MGHFLGNDIIPEVSAPNAALLNYKGSWQGHVLFHEDHLVHVLHPVPHARYLRRRKPERGFDVLVEDETFLRQLFELIETTKVTLFS
jgi:hypothetical protein